jgi:hypothetical protein
MPFNYRTELYDEDGPGEGPHFPPPDEPDEKRGPGPSAFGQEWATLPIPMPEVLSVFTDATGQVIAAWVDYLQVRWKDLDTVVTGVRQYNADLAPPEDPQDGSQDGPRDGPHDGIDC